MFKKATLFLVMLLSVVTMAAQNTEGGIKGTVVNRSGRTPISNAKITLYQSASDEYVDSDISETDGKFLFEGITNGIYKMVVTANGFSQAEVFVTVEGYMKDMRFVSLVANQKIDDVDDSSFAELDMDGAGFTDSPSILFSSNDVYNDIVGFGFSALRFKNRGYTNESQDVYLSGVKMNDAITGYSPFSLWSGLNEAMRSKESVMGSEVSDYGLGGYNGLTNFFATPSSVRTGWNFSVLSNSALYRLRLMATYASGELDNGWSYAFNVSARIGGNDWVKGVFYRNFAYYGGVEKKFNDVHRLGLTIFAAPGYRGAQNASTQEVYDLVGSNMYNSNWGYQNGKVRNARVRKTHEPVMILKYTATPSTDLEASATLLYRTGKNGYTALDWYDAADPRPDYYRNLPSYFWHENPDYGRQNLEKYAWAKEAWMMDLDNYTHVNWDNMYNINRMSQGQYGLRSKYVVEERRVDQNDVNLNANVKWRANDLFTLTGGLDLKWNRTEYYKKLDDLLGGEYYLDIDSFAERDFSATPTMTQNNLDYYMQHGEAPVLEKGSKYGYDYYAQVRNANLWFNGNFKVGGFSANVGAELGYNSFWRDGLVRKGLFPGLDDEGNPIKYQEKVLTTYDANGKAITSKGKSDVAQFMTYSAKLGLQYVFNGGHRIFADAAIFNDAPTFSQSFISPRTRNTMVQDLKTVKTLSADVNYQYSNNGYDLRVTGFWTKIKDQTDMMSFYDDSEHSFVNFAMVGIDQRHLGMELGFRTPFFLKGLSLEGALSLGEYIYTSIPRMTMTVDNSADIVRDNEMVPYWSSHPVFMKDARGEYVYPDEAYNQDGTIKSGFLPKVKKNQKHYVPSSPQMAANLGLNYKTSSYWFFELNAQYFGNSYLDMNPLYRTDAIVAGPDRVFTPVELEEMAAQERFEPVFLLNASIGKSWYIDYKYNFGFSLNINNITDNRNVKTGGYEQTRLIKSVSGQRYYRFDPKYFYMCGINYMLNLYFRF